MSHRVLRITPLLVATTTFAVALSALPAVGEEATPIHRTSAEACSKCHWQIFLQWQASVHGNSSALKDPIHGSFYRKVVGDPRAEGVTKGGKYPVCLQCHAPSAAVEGKTKLDANAAFSEGVTCVSCHTLQRFKGVQGGGSEMRLGVQAYELSTTHLHGPTGGRDNVQDHPFPLAGNGSLFRTNDACMGCHDRRNNPQGVPLCRTGDEYASSESFVTCQSCHMPVVNGLADHSMLGGHSDPMVARATDLQLVAAAQGDHIEAKVTVHNLLPHSFPTGAPFRNAYLKLMAFDGSGNAVWQSSSSHPLKDDPQAMFMVRLADDQGRPAPPPAATKVAGDSRLKPDEVRELTYQVPADGVVRLRAELFYNLLLPPMVKQLDGVLGDSLKAPKIAATAEVQL